MVLSTAHGASTLFVTEWNDIVYAVKFLDSTIDHSRYSSSAVAAATFDATSTAHGLAPVLTGESSKFFSSTGGYVALTSDDFATMSSNIGGIIIGATYSTRFLSSTGGFSALTSLTMNEISSAAGGICPIGTTKSTQFLTSTGGWHAMTSDELNAVSSNSGGICPIGTTVSQTYLSSTGGWNDMGREMWKRYTTGTATTMFSDLSTYVSELATVTSWAYPLYVLRIPPFVQQSKVDLSVGICSCSSNVVDTYAVLFMERSPRPGSNQPIDPKTTVTLSTKVPGVLWGYFPTTSVWATFTTQITVNGGQIFTFYALSTTAPKLKIKNILITGTTADPQYPADVWTTAWGSTVG